jgi:hypothetical protein
MSNDAVQHFPHQPVTGRPPEDRSAAVSAFHRLHVYALKSGKSALAIFAVYKALQKLEQREGEEHENSASKPTPIPLVSTPVWVRDGLWFALETYMIQPRQPGITEGKRVIEFKAALDAEWELYLQWFAVKSDKDANQLETIEPCLRRLTKLGYSKDKLRKAFNSVEKMFSDANSSEFDGEGERPRAPVQSRDMVPTRTLLKIFKTMPPFHSV